MCGIVGTISARLKSSNHDEIKMMADAVIHRGPDAEAYYESPNGKIAFGHRRLSIVGLDEKPTVMSITKKMNPNHRIAIVFNGEIYNYKELKTQFVDLGYSSISPSDFEVIVFAWEEWGENCVDHLGGEFAFVIYDEETDEVFMARDRTGVKPLFYGCLDGKFYFASEPKGILAAWPKSVRRVNHEAIAEFILGAHTFAAGTPRLGSSFFEGIETLKPGYCAKVVDGVVIDRQYWDLPFADFDVIDAPSTKEIHDAVTKSILDRIPEETGVAIGLSGGLDSSIVACVVANSGTRQKFGAASVKYNDESNADFEHATSLAEKMKMKLSATIISKESLLADIDKCVIAMDAPFDTVRRMAMLANYRTIHNNGFKVALIGEGSDEFNLGYYHSFPGLKKDIASLETAEAFRRTLRGRTDIVGRYFASDAQDTIDFDGIIDHTMNEDYLACKSQNPLIRMQYFYAKRFLTFLEDSNDRMAMANSIEARLPFVDRNVIEMCVRIPVGENVTEDLEKMALRKAFEGIVPEENRIRSKAPFPASKNMEMYSMLLDVFRKEIDRAPMDFWDLLNRKEVVNLADRFQAAVDEKRIGLDSWLPMTGAIDVRVSQVMAFLTLIRWYTLYFVEYV